KRCGAGFWTQTSPYRVASRTPSQDAGACGSFQRRSPTGGAANGMFLNTVTPSIFPGAPWTSPCWVRTGADTPTGAAAVADAELTTPPVCAQAEAESATRAQARVVRTRRDCI